MIASLLGDLWPYIAGLLSLAGLAFGLYRKGKSDQRVNDRVSAPEPERTAVIAAIHTWLQDHGLPPLEVTNVKDFGMVELWDDRAVRVRMNTGEVIA